MSKWFYDIFTSFATEVDRCGSFMGKVFSLLVVSSGQTQWTRRFTWFRPPERNTLHPWRWGPGPQDLWQHQSLPHQGGKDAEGHVTTPELISARRRGPCLDLELICGGTRFSGYRQWGNCISTPICKFNCNFIICFLTLWFYPYDSKMNKQFNPTRYMTYFLRKYPLYNINSVKYDIKR
jgi:hypothetical protein